MPREIEGRIYLTPPEAAKKVGISRWTLNRWLAAGASRKRIKIMQDRVSGRKYIAEESLAALRRDRFQTTTI